MASVYESIPERHRAAAVERVGGRLMIATADDQLHYFTDESEQPNEVGERIVELADGSRTVRQLAECLVEEFEVELETALADTAEFVQQLVDRKVLSWKTGATAGPNPAPGNR